MRHLRRSVGAAIAVLAFASILATVPSPAEPAPGTGAAAGQPGATAGEAATSTLAAAPSAAPTSDASRATADRGRIRVDPQIMVDQFGYLPAMDKVAVIADPVRGHNRRVEVVPGPVIQVRRSSDDAVVLEVAPVPWRGGRVDRLSGDRGWTVDFSAVRTPGTYHLYDVERRVRSHEFRIAAGVYDDLLDAALKVFWYNRANVAHRGPLAGPWRSGPVAAGPGQDGEARHVDDRRPETARDLSGGWFDAGDANKYVTFAASAVHQLLTIWQRHPGLFDDDIGIPESGNGRSDLVDELLVELDWLERMQDPDGGVLVKVGFIDFSYDGAPARDRRPRFYEEACSSSTIAAAAMFAHASVALADVVPDRAADWRRRAESAWNWYRSNPVRDDCDPQIVTSGDADLTLAEQDQTATLAAIHLFIATGREEYHDVIRSGLTRMRPWVDQALSRYFPEQTDGVLAYFRHPDADPALVAEVEALLRSVSRDRRVSGPATRLGLYRSYVSRATLHWGSNSPLSNVGTGNVLLAESGVSARPASGHLDRAAAHLHTLHGTNPLGLTYLSNTGRLGAEQSVQSLYHFWFRDGSRFDGGRRPGPAPAYVVGGPNAAYSGSPPLRRPALKSYRDFNPTDDRRRSWELSEPSISYQADYLRLLAETIAAFD